MTAATQIALPPCPGEPPHGRSVAPAFGSEVLVGKRVADGAATVVTDLRSMHSVTRFLVFDHALNQRRAGCSPCRNSSTGAPAPSCACSKPWRPCR